MHQSVKPKRQPTKEELLAKAQEPAKIAMKLHPYYRGKIQTIPRAPIRSFDDFAIWYTRSCISIFCTNQE